MTNKLYYGDNLHVLREHVKDESVDLVYLDPPFNSAANYNILFRAPSGEQSQAQIEAFEDTWHWNDSAALAFDEVLKSSNTDAAHMLRATRSFLGENDMMAYLAMMAVRLLELHRVLKPTGSLYLHCDPVASHYLKMILDAIFGPTRFQNEIIWRRTGSHNKAKRWAPIHDVILYYTKSENFTWNKPRRPYMLGHVKEHFVDDGKGGYRTDYYGNVLTGSGTRKGESGKPWRGFDPTAKGRHWAIPGAIWDEAGIDPEGMTQHEKLDLLFKEGFITITEGEAWPIYQMSVRPDQGPAAPDIWAYQPYTEGTVFGSKFGIDEDVRWLSPRDQERLGYPTQKPVALLERIISASSNEDDIILDPFCGCGTTIHAAQKLNRQWIGIDVTHLAISLIERRMKDAFPGISFEVLGTPKDLAGARDLARRDKYQFQWWATSLAEGVPAGGKKKGMDRGIDGYLNFRDGDGEPQFAIISVKGGDNVSAPMIRDLKGTIEREKAAIGVFISLVPPTREMVKEASAHGFYETGGKKFPRIQMLTVDDLLSGKRAQVPFGFVEGYKAAPKEKASKQGRLF